MSRTLADDGFPEPPAGDEGGHRWFLLVFALIAAVLVLGIGAGAILVTLYLVSI